MVPDPPPIENSIKDEHMDGNGFDDNSGGDWQGFQGNGGSSNNFQHAPIEEPRPIGIKEDG